MKRHTFRPFALGNGVALVLLGLAVMAGSPGLGLFCLIAGIALVVFSGAL